MCDSSLDVRELLEGVSFGISGSPVYIQSRVNETLYGLTLCWQPSGIIVDSASWRACSVSNKYLIREIESGRVTVEHCGIVDRVHWSRSNVFSEECDIKVLEFLLMWRYSLASNIEPDALGRVRDLLTHRIEALELLPSQTLEAQDGTKKT